MSKLLSITDLTEQLQELESAQKKYAEIDKLFDKFCKLEFGKSTKEIHSLIEENKPKNQNDLIN